MKVIKLTESDLNRIVRRVIQNEQDTDEEPKKELDTNVVLGLRNFSRGRITKDDLYSIDDTIYDINQEEPLGQSIITVRFEDEKEFLDAINMDEQDVWFMRLLNSYDGYEFMDSWSVRNDFEEGYIIYWDLNEENTKKLKLIAETILPGEEYVLNNNDDEYKIKLSKLLLELFDNEMDWILDDYAAEVNNEMNTVAKKSVKEEFNDKLESFGFNLNYDMDEVEVTVAELYMGAIQHNLFTSNCKEIVTSLISSALGNNVGGWYENSYEFRDDEYFDKESFNNTVERQLDKIIEKLEETSDEVYTIKDFVEFRNRVLSKYKLKSWYQTPKDKNIMFIIQGFDQNQMKVKLHVKEKGVDSIKAVDLDEEQFNNFLSQNSLFSLEDMY
jgi:uncharacterized protein YxeA